MTTENIDITADATTLADLLGVTPRRVRQLAEERVLCRVSRGRFSIPQAMHATIGRKILSAAQKKRADALTLTAVGWLEGLAIGGGAVMEKDRDLWRSLCSDCGYGRGASEAALVNGVRLLGSKAPAFSE